MTKQKDLKGKNIFMVKDGQYVKWDGSDVSHLLIKEQVTLAQLKRHFPKEYLRFKKEGLI